MAQHESAIKAHKQSLKRALRNRITKTQIKTYSKKVEDGVASKDFNQATIALRKAESVIMKAVTKNVLKLNTAARKVSNLTHKVKAIENTAASA
jgi:small subunit ribosomal protein S20